MLNHSLSAMAWFFEDVSPVLQEASSVLIYLVGIPESCCAGLLNAVLLVICDINEDSWLRGEDHALI